MSLDLLCMEAVPASSSSAFISHLQHRLAGKQAEPCVALDNMIILFINLFYPQQSRDLTQRSEMNTHTQSRRHFGTWASVRRGGGGGVLRVTFITWQFAGRCEDPRPHPTLVLSVHALLLNGGINITVKGAMLPRVHVHIIAWLWATSRTKDAKKGVILSFTALHNHSVHSAGRPRF